MREALHAAWQQWTDEADLDGVTDFYGLQALAVRSLVETGETFAHLIPTAAGLRVRLLDGDMLPLSLSRLSASKHALLEAITEEVIARYQEMLQHALADSTTPTPALVRALFALMGAGIEEDRRFYRAVSGRPRRSASGSTRAAWASARGGKPWRSSCSSSPAARSAAS